MKLTSEVPGIKARHVIITPNCRRVHGGWDQALEVAIDLIRKEYAACELDCNNLADFHLALTIDRPDTDP